MKMADTLRVVKATIEYLPQTDTCVVEFTDAKRAEVAAMLGSFVSDILKQKALSRNDVLSVVQAAFSEFEGT